MNYSFNQVKILNEQVSNNETNSLSMIATFNIDITFLLFFLVIIDYVLKIIVKPVVNYFFEIPSFQ